MSLHSQKYFFYMTLNILNHVLNKASAANNIDIRARQSIAGMINYFGVNIQNSIWSLMYNEKYIDTSGGEKN
jgi:hypothetical protein